MGDITTGICNCWQRCLLFTEASSGETMWPDRSAPTIGKHKHPIPHRADRTVPERGWEEIHPQSDPDWHSTPKQMGKETDPDTSTTPGIPRNRKHTPKATIPKVCVLMGCTHCSFGNLLQVIMNPDIPIQESIWKGHGEKQIFLNKITSATRFVKILAMYKNQQKCNYSLSALSNNALKWHCTPLNRTILMFHCIW